MNFSCATGRVERVLSFLPVQIEREIRRICRSREGDVSGIREIRARRGARCSVSYKNEKIVLKGTLSHKDAEDMLEKISGGSLYACRDKILNGYIPLGDGIRVGLCGTLSYEGGSAVGASDIGSFVFRIPTGECEFSEELLSVYRGEKFAGMLIYSPPGVGKTTALRSLAGEIGKACRVCVVDERCEFIEEDYLGSEVDILRGYHKRDGIEIACRTMSPEVIMVDEIGFLEAGSLLGVVRCGVPIVATAHARSFFELSQRADLSSLIGSGAFDVFVGIGREGGRYSLTVDRK